MAVLLVVTPLTVHFLISLLVVLNLILIQIQLLRSNNSTQQQKFASVTTNNGKTYIKGAPEFILNDCYYYLDKDGNKQNFTDDIKARFQELSLEQANRSMRLLAILNTDGNDKVLIGIVCIRDNVRSSIKQTVETMNRAGVQVVW